MTWWTSLYFALYVTFGLYTSVDDVTHKHEPLWHVTLEIVGDVCLLLVAVSYWVPSLRSSLAPLLMPLFVAGVLVFAAQVFGSVRKNVILDHELPMQGKLVVGGGAVLLIALVTGPALVWGFLSAVLGRASA